MHWKNHLHNKQTLASTGMQMCWQSSEPKLITSTSALACKQLADCPAEKVQSPKLHT